MCDRLDTTCLLKFGLWHDVARWYDRPHSLALSWQGGAGVIGFQRCRRNPANGVPVDRAGHAAAVESDGCVLEPPLEHEARLAKGRPERLAWRNLR